MFSHSHKPSLAGFVVLAGLLAAPASAPAAAYEHNQTNLELLGSKSAITDGTSNTIMFGELVRRTNP